MQEMIEECNLDRVMALAAYKVMTILVDKTHTQARRKVSAQYGQGKRLKAFGEHGDETVQAESSQIQ